MKVDIVTFQRLAQVLAGIEKTGQAKVVGYTRAGAPIEKKPVGTGERSVADVIRNTAQMFKGKPKPATTGTTVKPAKTAAENEPPEQQVPPKRKKARGRTMLEQAYPDYGRSLVSQRKQDPHTAGLVRGATTGTVGAVLAALLARMLTDKPSAVATSAMGGAALGGIPGYLSGKHEAESEYTKALALRRLGINNPAEMMVFDRSQILTPKVVRRGEVL